MKKNYYIILAYSAGIFLSQSQIKVLDTLAISTVYQDLKRSETIQRITLNPVLSLAIPPSEQIKSNTTAFLRENSRGGVTSISFRGTTASQTNVLWNGLPLNSLLLGQTDFSTLAGGMYDVAEIFPGGSAFGSGSIGGSIELKNNFNKKKGFHTDILGQLSSFKSKRNVSRIDFSNDKVSVFSIFEVGSGENEYEVPLKSYVNRNGDFHQENFQIGLKVPLLPDNSIKLEVYSQFYLKKRGFPIFFKEQSKPYYQDIGSRSIAHLYLTRERWSGTLSIGQTQEGYSYFPDRVKDFSYRGAASQLFISSDEKWQIIEGLKLFNVNQIQIQSAKEIAGSLGNVHRTLYAPLVGVEFSKLKNFGFIGYIKKEWTSTGKDSPILYSGEVDLYLLPFWKIMARLGKQYRNPTFNDLYWKPGGNPNLAPEIGTKKEITVSFKNKNIALHLSGYNQKIQDMIRWIPTNSGYYAPKNETSVQIRGVEMLGEASFTSSNWKIQQNLGFNYVKSKNTLTGFQLAFIPTTTAISNTQITYSTWAFYFNARYSADIPLEESNIISKKLDPYFNASLGGSKEFPALKMRITVYCDNLTNAIQSTVENYYLPLRNYSIQIRFTL